MDKPIKSKIPRVAVTGMYIMTLGIILILPLPSIGVPMMFIGFIMALLPHRP